MAILTQILLVLVAFGTLYASFVHNREKYNEVIGILPDFKKLFRDSRTANVKVVVCVPDAQADVVRRAAGEAGAGVTGHYSFQSFSSQGIGRYTPEEGAHPAVGTIGKAELVDQERIEFTCSRQKLAGVLTAIKNAHPYEETVFDIYPIEALEAETAVHSPSIASH